MHKAPRLDPNRHTGRHRSGNWWHNSQHMEDCELVVNNMLISVLYHAYKMQDCMQTPILAVEPNLDMLQKAKEKEGIDVLQATADEFLTQLAPKSKYNKILFSHCAHHLQNPAATFRVVLEALPQDGRCVVINYPKNFSRFYTGRQLTSSSIVKNVHKRHEQGDDSSRNGSRGTCMRYQ